MITSALRVMRTERPRTVPDHRSELRGHGHLPHRRLSHGLSDRNRLEGCDMFMHYENAAPDAHMVFPHGAGINHLVDGARNRLALVCIAALPRIRSDNGDTLGPEHGHSVRRQEG